MILPSIFPYGTFVPQGVYFLSILEGMPVGRGGNMSINTLDVFVF